MKTERYILSLIMLTFICQVSVSQEIQQKRFPLKGTVIDKSTGETIPFVTIFNEGSRSWTLTDEDGEYSIPVSKGDTLVYTAIGFFGELYKVKGDSVLRNNKIYLTSQSYDIQEVKIIGYKDYDAFKEAFLNLDLPTSKEEIVKQNLNQAGIIAAKDAAYQKRADDKFSNPGIGIGFSLGRTVAEEKTLKQKWEQEEAMQYVIDKKFNRKIVFDLTKLEDDELTDFIGYCNFSMDYLYNTNEYDILEKIMQKFQVYKAMIDSCNSRS